ncbi:MAG: SurA N-terminal domain-containing protein [Betaproteobacteria bacterium]|nr:SurA N-terminal domain-containing protein [Betaproteobacteria bacterium]
MFDFVHENKKLVQIVLAIIILPFAFWGIDSYRKSGGAAPLATVNGEKISQQEFDNALRQQQDRLRESLGGKIDQAVLDQPEVKNSILENLVSQHLLMSQARAVGLTVSDEQLAQVITGIESFQKDGKFDKQSYVTALGKQNMSPLAFEARVRQEMSMRQLIDAYTRNGYASNAIADNLIRLNEQQRVISISEIALDPFLKQVKVDEPAVKNYYEKNTKEFQAPEQARVEYVVFSAEALQPQMAADDAEIKKYYAEHQPEFGTQEQRQAAHILISVAAQASEADKQAAKAKAEQILQQVNKSPAKFAELAKQYSQDPGSAANGGDLGMFGRGMMVKPFDDAVFRLKPGEISGLVQSEFGFHIIKLLAVQPAKTLSLDEAKGDIAQKLKQQKANDKFAELAEKFSNTVYEQSDTLKPAAELVKMPVQQSGWLNRGQAETPPWTDKALQAVFAKEVVTDRRNSAAVEVAPNTLLAARVLEYKPASIRPLAEVSDAIRQKLMRQQAHELVLKQAKDMLAQLQRGENLKLEWKPAQTITRAQHTGQSSELVRQVFQADAAKLPAYAGAENAQGGYTLARLDAVKEVAAIDDAKRAGYLQQLRQLAGDELSRAYLADARKNAKISMKTFVADDKK